MPTPAPDPVAASNTVLEDSLITAIALIVACIVAVVVVMALRAWGGGNAGRVFDDAGSIVSSEATTTRTQSYYDVRPPSIDDDPLPKYLPSGTPRRSHPRDPLNYIYDIDQVSMRSAATTRAGSLFHWLGVRAPTYKTTIVATPRGSMELTDSNPSNLSTNQLHRMRAFSSSSALSRARMASVAMGMDTRAASHRQSQVFLSRLEPTATASAVFEPQRGQPPPPPPPLAVPTQLQPLPRPAKPLSPSVVSSHYHDSRVRTHFQAAPSLQLEEPDDHIVAAPPPSRVSSVAFDAHSNPEPCYLAVIAEEKL